jgi:hypothetical protein
MLFLSDVGEGGAIEFAERVGLGPRLATHGDTRGRNPHEESERRIVMNTVRRIVFAAAALFALAFGGGAHVRW